MLRRGGSRHVKFVGMRGMDTACKTHGEARVGEVRALSL